MNEDKLATLLKIIKYALIVLLFILIIALILYLLIFWGQGAPSGWCINEKIFKYISDAARIGYIGAAGSVEVTYL